ncbi:MAG: hypothetical protein P8J45_01355 [Phycisphaerales bacterium]|nr:hypothetical protein [Phycisphaerales bacterium]
MLNKRIIVLLAMVSLACTVQVQEAQAQDGSLACWGVNGHGQCDVPSGVGEPGNLVTAVAGGYGHTVALLGREVPPVPGDFNGDGVLDGADYIAIREHLGICAADIDANEVVDGVDLSYVLGSWGSCTTGP